MNNIGQDPIPGLHKISPDNCVLKLLNGPKAGQQFPVNQLRMLIGRSDPPQIQVDIDLASCELDSPAMTSRRHAVLEWQEDELLLTDLNSTNGTYVDGRPLHSLAEKDSPTPCPVKLGSHLVFGNLEFEIIKH